MGEDAPPLSPPPPRLSINTDKSLLSPLISPSSCPAPPPPPPPEARGRRGGTGACDWLLHCTACREPEDRREEVTGADKITPGEDFDRDFCPELETFSTHLVCAPLQRR